MTVPFPTGPTESSAPTWHSAPPTSFLTGRNKGCKLSLASVFILYNITQCPQVVDLVVDAQAIGAGRVAGIVPAAGQAVVVGAPDIAGDAGAVLHVSERPGAEG